MEVSSTGGSLKRRSRTSIITPLVDNDVARSRRYLSRTMASSVPFGTEGVFL